LVTTSELTLCIERTKVTFVKFLYGCMDFWKIKATLLEWIQQIPSDIKHMVLKQY